jgi:acyl carrier protein
MPEFAIEEQVKQILADILDLDPNSIDGSTEKDHIASWDSLNHINLVVALEQEFRVSFDLNEIEGMLSFQDIVEILERKVRN